MKKLRFILLSAVLTAVFGFSFIGCSNYSSNGSSSNHDMTIQWKDESGTTYTYYADYAADDNLARRSLDYEMKVFNSDGTEITDGSVSINHSNEEYTLFLYNEINKGVIFWTQKNKFYPYTLDGTKNTKEISELTINGNQYTLAED